MPFNDTPEGQTGCCILCERIARNEPYDSYKLKHTCGIAPDIEVIAFTPTGAKYEKIAPKPELTAREYLEQNSFTLDSQPFDEWIYDSKNNLKILTKPKAEVLLEIQRKEAIQECIDKLEDYQNTEYYVNMLKGLLK